jgi:hypothetical protein
MVGRSSEFYSCFIRYSTKDQEFAERLYVDLQAKGLRPPMMSCGANQQRTISVQVDEAIRLHDKILLILSQHSKSSNWVNTEIANARAREGREHKQLLFPITLAPFEIWRVRMLLSRMEVSTHWKPSLYLRVPRPGWNTRPSGPSAFTSEVKNCKPVGRRNTH